MREDTEDFVVSAHASPKKDAFDITSLKKPAEMNERR